MKKLLRILPLLAMVLGVGVAIASHVPTHHESNIKKAFIDGVWVDITGKVLNEDYVCDTAPSHNCTAEFTPQGQMIPGTLVNGDYREL